MTTQTRATGEGPIQGVGSNRNGAVHAVTDARGANLYPRRAAGRWAPGGSWHQREATRRPLRPALDRARSTVLAALALAMACAASAKDYTGARHLKHNGWERLHVLVTLLTDDCGGERDWSESVRKVFRSAHVTPVISFHSQFERKDGGLEQARWRDHTQDEVYLLFDIGCIPRVENWGIVVGSTIYVGAAFYAWDAESGSHRSLGHPVRAFGEAGILKAGATTVDYVILALGEVLDRYLKANLGSAEAVVAYRNAYPDEARLKRIFGPFGVKSDR